MPAETAIPPPWAIRGAAALGVLLLVAGAAMRNENLVAAAGILCCFTAAAVS